MDTPESRTDSNGKGKRSKNPRRFSDEQIKSLESIFKLETKLEPSKKLKLAKDLGLQPRQIAIWFQNRRARWKSRQIEQEYKVLRESYDTLYLQFDDLKREKQSLQMQLEELSDAVKNLGREDIGNSNAVEGIMEKNAERATNYFKEEGPLRWEEGEEISQAWCNLSSCGLFDQSPGTSSSNWWDY